MSALTLPLLQSQLPDVLQCIVSLKLNHTASLILDDSTTSHECSLDSKNHHTVLF